jgi:hypothetical protein
MTRPDRLIRQYLCGHYHTHELEWVWFDMNGVHRCRHCHKPMTLDPARTYVGVTAPDNGD